MLQAALAPEYIAPPSRASRCAGIRYLYLVCAALLLCSAGGNAAEQLSTTSPRLLKLLTYNIHIGVPMGKSIGQDHTSIKELQAQADVITTSGADIVALQEVDCEYGYTLPPARQRSGVINQPRLLAHLCKMNYVFGSAQDDIRYPSDNAGYVEWGSADKWTNNGAVHGEVGNALLSRYPIMDPPSNISLTILPEKERRACIRTEILLDGTTETQGARCVVYASHLQHDNEASRARQMYDIVDRAGNEQQDKLVFIMGDFNETPPPGDEPDMVTTHPLQLARNTGFVDLHRHYATTHGKSAEFTFPADTPNRRIDYILCNRKLNVTDARIYPSLASDHLALMVTVELPGK